MTLLCSSNIEEDVLEYICLENIMKLVENCKEIMSSLLSIPLDACKYQYDIIVNAACQSSFMKSFFAVLKQLCMIVVSIVACFSVLFFAFIVSMMFIYLVVKNLITFNIIFGVLALNACIVFFIRKTHRKVVEAAKNSENKCKR